MLVSTKNVHGGKNRWITVKIGKRNRKISKVNKWQGRESQRKSAGECEEEREQNLNSRADRGQREVGGAVGGARVTVTAAAFKHRCTLGGRTGQKT